jgi:opacity protein-like surface antigen
MNRAIRTIGLLAGLLAFLPSGVRAEDSTRSRPGLYANLGPVGSFAAFDVPSTAGQQDSWGLDARVGYRFHPHLAAEAQYQWAARFEVTSGGATQEVVTTHAVTANGKIFIFQGPLQPYILLGLGLVNANFRHSSDHTAPAFRAGGGVQILFTDHIGIYGDITYLKPFTSLGDWNQVPIAFGGTYSF